MFLFTLVTLTGHRCTDEELSLCDSLLEARKWCKVELDEA